MRAIACLLGVALLCGCSGASETPAPIAVDTSPPAAANATAPAIREPQAAQRAPEALLVQDGVNYACRTDGDCAVKDIGNCCGYHPACVNAESPTFPDKVKAECAAEGRMAVCGFREIGGCACVEGRCTEVAGATVEPVQ